MTTATILWKLPVAVKRKMLKNQFKEAIVEGASSAFLRKKREAHPSTRNPFYRNYWCSQVNHLRF